MYMLEHNPLYRFTAAAVLLFFLASYVPILRAQDESSSRGGGPRYKYRVDSLLNIIDTASGPQLLLQYPRLHKALYEVGDLELQVEYNRQFAEAACKARDRNSEAKAAVLKVEALYNYRAPDSLLLAESLLAMEILRDIPGAEVHYYYTASVVGDIYLLAGQQWKTRRSPGAG